MYMLLEREGFRVGTLSREYVHDIFWNLGDSRCVEQTHQFLRAQDDLEASNQISARYNRFWKAIRCEVLRDRTKHGVQNVNLQANEQASIVTATLLDR
jgi:hypothetical protein